MENLNNTDESPNSPTSPNLQSSESVYESSSDLNFLLLLEKGSELALNTLSLILFPIVSLTHPLKSLLLISLVWVPQILFRKFCKIKNGAVQEEMRALHKNGTWDLVELPIRKVLGCKWVFTVKFKSDVKIDWYKAKLGCKRIHTNLRDQLPRNLCTGCKDELSSSSTLTCYHSRLAFTPTRCKECFSLWRFRGRSIHGIATGLWGKF